jgi:hypothetical protein
LPSTAVCPASLERFAVARTDRGRLVVTLLGGLGVLAGTIVTLARSA